MKDREGSTITYLDFVCSHILLRMNIEVVEVRCEMICCTSVRIPIVIIE